MRKIPYGQINFERIIKENYLYVDKTKYIEKLENLNETSLFYLRPGRFGKSLFTNMLDYYYAIDKTDKFDELFNNLYIKDHPTVNKNNYYILNFDFSGIDSNDNWDIDILMEAFNAKVIDGITKFIERYNIKFNIDKTQTPSTLIGSLITHFEGLKLENKIYIIIDEYDNYTNGILKGNAEKFLTMLTGEGFIKGFYAKIKEAIKAGVVERFFATGIAPMTLDSMTTGFNIATDLTRKPKFVSMIGLTKQEVKNVIKEVLPQKRETEQEEIYKEMEQYYDGYRFSEVNEETTFNTTLVMYYLKEYVESGKRPLEMLDMNVSANFEKLENLITLKNNEYSKEVLESLIQNKDITEKIVNKFNLKMDITRDVVLSMLFYFGYSTIKENDVTFKIPNYVMSGIYNDYFIQLLKREGTPIDVSKIKEAIRELAYEGKIDKLCYQVEEYLSYLGNITWQKYDEKYVKGYHKKT